MKETNKNKQIEVLVKANNELLKVEGQMLSAVKSQGDISAEGVQALTTVMLAREKISNKIDELLEDDANKLIDELIEEYSKGEENESK